MQGAEVSPKAAWQRKSEDDLKKSIAIASALCLALLAALLVNSLFYEDSCYERLERVLGGDEKYAGELAEAELQSCEDYYALGSRGGNE